MIRIDLGKDELNNIEGSDKKVRAINNTMRAAGLFRSSGQQKVFFFIIIVAACVVAMIPGQFISNYKDSVTEEYKEQDKKWQKGIRALTVQIRKLNAFKTELDSYNRQKGLTEKRLSVVRELLNLRGTPVNVLDTIGQALPVRSWVRDISIEMKPDASTVQINGSAFSNEEVSDYVDKLNESVYLRDVKLIQVLSQVESKQGTSLKIFQIMGSAEIKD